jgi:hypothetical protein
MTDNAVGLLLLGGGVAAAMVARAKWASPTNPTSSSSSPLPPVAPRAVEALDEWIYPVPNLGDRRAETSSEFRPGTKNQHLGVDIMFKRRDPRDLIAVYRAGTTNGTPHYFMPDHIPALAVSAGVATFAAWTPVGNSVIVRHPNGWATYYTHLATLEVRKGQSIVAGQTLGTIGASPLDGEHLMHLHFEMWKGGVRTGAVDPDPHLAAWSRRTIAWEPASSTPAVAALRNAALSAYRPVGDTGEPYPEWVRRLRGESGVYSIREIGGPIVYVGSSVGRLYDTLTRHFQSVRHEAKEIPMT